MSGTLKIHGVNAGASQSFWDAGILEINTDGVTGNGAVNLDGGRFTYNGGEIDTIHPDGGCFYVYDGGELKLVAPGGKIGATLFIGRTADPFYGPATLTFAPAEGGNEWFFKDAKIIIYDQAVANLYQGGIKLWNFGAIGAATGDFENLGGITTVIGNVTSEMFFDNESTSRATGSTTLEGQATLMVFTVGVPPENDDPPQERLFLTGTTGIAGHWQNVFEDGEYTGWVLEDTQDKLTTSDLSPPPPPP